MARSNRQGAGTKSLLPVRAPRDAPSANESAGFQVGVNQHNQPSLELRANVRVLSSRDTATFVTVSAATVFRLANLHYAAIMRPRADFSTE